MQELERVAAVLKPTDKMLAWINQHGEPDESLSLADIRTDCTVLLLPSFNNEEEAEKYLLEIYNDIFANELSSWNDEESLWPDNRTIEVFLEWFDIEFHSVIYDMVLDNDDLSIEEEEESETKISLQ